MKNKFLLCGDISRILKESFTEAKINLLCIFKPEAGWHCGKGPEDRWVVNTRKESKHLKDPLTPVSVM